MLSYSIGKYQFPSDWNEYTINELLFYSKKPIAMKDDDSYELVTVKRRFGGAVSRSHLEGRKILVKSQFQVNEGDFVISKRQISHGACALIPRELDGAIVSNEYNVFRSSDSLDLNFFNYYVRLPFMRRYFYIMSDGVHIEKLLFKPNEWLKQKVCLPNIDEQKRVADIMLTWDRAIDMKEKLIIEKRKLFKERMRMLLTGEVRLRGFSDPWLEERIDGIGKLKGGSGFPEKYQGIKGDIPFFKVSDMNNTGNEKYMVNSNNYIDEKALKSIRANLLPSYSIIFAKVGAALLLERKRIVNQECCIDNNMMALKVDKEYDIDFIYYKLIQTRLSKYANVGALPSVNGKDIGAIRLSIPPTKVEQEVISCVLNVFDEEISLLEKELDFLKIQKKGLIQHLFTGILRSRKI